MFSRRHKKILLVTGSIASGKSFICKKIYRKNITYVDLDKVVNSIYEENIDFKNKLFIIDSSLIKKDKINKNNVKNAVSKNPKLLDLLEKILYPILISKLDLLLKESQNLLLIVEVPLLFEKNFTINFSYRTINVFCSRLIHRKRLNSRFIQSTNLFKNIILKRHYSQEKKSIFSDEFINSCCNGRLKNLLIEILLSKYLN